MALANRGRVRSSGRNGCGGCGRGGMGDAHEAEDTVRERPWHCADVGDASSDPAPTRRSARPTAGRLQEIMSCRFTTSVRSTGSST